MLLFCPDCQLPFTGVSRCPRCGGLLLMPDEAPRPAGGTSRAPEAPVKSTPTGRAIVGTVIALGMYLGLRQLATGGIVAASRDADAWWHSADALTVAFFLQAFATVFGAILASAGQTRGIGLGALVGLACGALYLGVEVIEGAPLQLVLLLQPVLILICGAIAGSIGGRIWPPVPELEMPAPLVKKSSSIELLQDAPEAARRPTRWFRILIGSVIMVAGLGLAEKSRYAAEKASRGMLRVESRGQGSFMSWQIATIAVLLGGAISGSATGAGLRHGIISGVVGGIGGAALAATRGGFSQPEEYLLRYMKLAQNPQDPAALFGVGAAVLVAAMVGGWFGGQLFPPLGATYLRRRFRLND